MPDPQAQSQNDLRRLYGVASQVFNVGDFDTFRSKISDPARRRKFYDSIQATGKVNLGDYDLFSGKVDAGLSETQPITGKQGRIASVEDLLAGKNRPEVVEADKHNIPPSPELSSRLPKVATPAAKPEVDLAKLLSIAPGLAKFLPSPLTTPVAHGLGKLGELMQKPAPTDEEISKLGFLEKAERSALGSTAGMAGQASSYLLDRLGQEDAGQYAREQTEKALAATRTKTTAQANKKFDIADIGTADFWATDAAATVPPLLALLPLGMAGATLSGPAAAALVAKAGITGGLASTLTGALSSIGGALASRPVESLMEASSTYEDLLKQGAPKEKAAEAAAQTFRANLSLVGLDAAQLASIMFGNKAPKGVVSGFSKFANKAFKVGKIGAGALSEGLEEKFQSWVSDVTKDFALGKTKEYDFSPQEFYNYINQAPLWQQEDFVLGTLMGLGAEGVGVLREMGQSEDEIRDAIKRNPQAAVSAAQQATANAASGKPIMPAKKSPVIISLADEPDAESPAVESAAPAVNDEQKETVAKSVFGKSFAELSQPQKNLISKKIAEAAAKDEDARVSAAVKNLFAPQEEKKAEKVASQTNKQPESALETTAAPQEVIPAVAAADKKEKTAPPSTPPTQPESAPPIAQQAAPAEVAPKSLEGQPAATSQAEPTIPKEKKPTPDRTLQIGRGMNGNVRVVFPDKAHADLYALIGRFRRRVHSGKNSPKGLTAGVEDADRLAKKFGVTREEIFKKSDEYREQIKGNINGLQQGDDYTAPSVSFEKPAAQTPTPPIERVSPPVPASEQAKPEIVSPAAGSETTQAEKQVAANVQQLPITDIATDVDRFQNRASDFSEKTAATVAERFDPNLFDPIVVWRDPDNDKTFVLSGHSRLEGMKRRGEKNIPARYFDGDEQAAMNYAQVQANRLGTTENLSESIKAYRTAKSQNLSRAKLKDLFDGDLDFLDAAQNLDQKGDFVNILNQPAAAEFPYVKRFSRWVGELRGKYADKLTDRHEQQIFDWLYKGEKKNVDTSKDAFFKKVETQVDRSDFSPEQPLVLKRGEVAQTGTRGRADTAALERELDQLREDRKKARTLQEVDTIDKEIARISKGIAEIVKTQPDLFSAAEEKPVAQTQPEVESVATSAPAKTESPESQPTAKNYDRAVEIFNRVIDRSRNKPTEAQQEAVREELEAAGVHPIIIQELTEPKRSPRPEESDFPEEIGIGDAYDFLRKVESKQYATTRKGRIESAIDPPAELKAKVDAIADAGKAMVDAEASLEQAKKDIIGEIEKRGGTVVVNTDTGAFTITLNTGKAKMGLQDILALKKLRQEAAEAGAYSLATVGRGFEIAVTPEKVADAKPLTGTFAEKAKEFIRRNQTEKEAGKALDAAKRDARNDLVDHYLTERAAEREPRAFKGAASDGTAAQVLIRRNRSAVDPDIAVGGRDFPTEIQSFKEDAATRAERGKPFISTRETGKKTFAEALKAGRVVNTESPKFGANNTIVTREQLDDAFASLAKKVNLNTGIDPSTLPELLKIGTFYVEGGIREFGTWSDKMVASLTERVNAAFAERVKPNLKIVWNEIKKRRPGLFRAVKATTAPDLFSAPEPVTPQNPVAEKTIETGTTPSEIKTEKEPWEMTQADFIGAIPKPELDPAFSYLHEEGVNDAKQNAWKITGEIGELRWRRGESQIVTGPGMPYSTTRKEWQKAFDYEIKKLQAEYGHKKDVTRALRSGKPVPANVLADYPDLAKLAKSETVATPKPEPPKNILQAAAQRAASKKPTKNIFVKEPPGGFTEADRVPEKYRKQVAGSNALENKAKTALREIENDERETDFNRENLEERFGKDVVDYLQDNKYIVYQQNNYSLSGVTAKGRGFANIVLEEKPSPNILQQAAKAATESNKLSSDIVATKFGGTLPDGRKLVAKNIATRNGAQQGYVKDNANREIVEYKEANGAQRFAVVEKVSAKTSESLAATSEGESEFTTIEEITMRDAVSAYQSGELGNIDEITPGKIQKALGIGYDRAKRILAGLKYRIERGTIASGEQSTVESEARPRIKTNFISLSGKYAEVPFSATKERLEKANIHIKEKSVDRILLAFVKDKASDAISINAYLAKSENGKPSIVLNDRIGAAVFGKQRDGKWSAYNFYVGSELLEKQRFVEKDERQIIDGMFKRKGIGTAIYDMMEMLGYDIRPSNANDFDNLGYGTTPESKAFWKKRLEFQGKGYRIAQNGDIVLVEPGNESSVNRDAVMPTQEQRAWADTPYKQALLNALGGNVELAKEAVQGIGEKLPDNWNGTIQKQRAAKQAIAEYVMRDEDVERVFKALQDAEEQTAQPSVKEGEKPKEAKDVTSIDRDLEPIGARATTGDQVGERVVPAESRRIREKGQRGVRETTEDLFAPSGRELSADEAATGREQSDSSPFAESPGIERRTAGDQFGERGGDSGVSGAAVEPVAAKAVARSSEQLSPFSAKVIAQGKAENIPVKIGNRANIDATLPFLKDGQRDDVAFAEKRFAKSDGYGVMFTNGTGTGKTFSGLGIIKRMAKSGKDNIIVVVPSDKIAYDWVERGKLLKLNIKKLYDTKDNGRREVVVTTYANFGQNANLAKRNWDAVVLDEAHYLMQAKQGSSTNALDTLRAISLHPRGAYARAARVENDLFEKLQAYRQGKTDAPQALLDKWRETIDATQKEVDAAQGEKRPRVVFLSATPFAYEKAVDYAEGFLFDYPPVDTGARYNQPSGSDQFMVQHFGYRMRYNKLTEPDKDVDRGLMQRTFNSWLKQQGVLSGRRLDVDADYDRRFILSETKVGHAIDEGLQWLWDRKRMQPLRDIVAKQFDHLSRRYLLEAIKANEVIKPIKANLAAGRKVVVFHDFKKGGAFNPFDIRVADDNPTIVYYTDEAGKRQDVRLKTLVDEFREARPDLISLPIASFPSPIVGLTKALPDAMVFNGDIPKAERIRIVNKFQDDNSGKDLIIVQAAAGKEGISLHDTTGKKPRILFNLGLPTQPTTSIQQEGRIYREGQASNAMFRYLNTGTNWERFAFAETIAQRSSAAENLALGVEARALLDSFIQAYEQSDTYPVGHEGEGIGGKLGDKKAESMLTDWDRAISMYFAQQKKTSRTKAQEGTDYFATPEPLGQKMVEWANIRPGDAVLEPSAGHGAIARWFPDLTPKTVIEPSSGLASRLKMVAPEARLVQDRFENFHIVNKYDAIVMNPPFGVGGKTAMEHLEKASQHLKDGGRIVAIIPRGETANKRFDKWMYGEDSKGLYLTANIELPAVTFERAGTKTSARVVVIDKIESRDVAQKIQQQDRDYSDAETIKDFFDRIENSSIQPRVDAAEIAGEVEAPKQPVVSLTEIADTATQQQSEYGYPITEHTTATGKLLRGTIRTDISYQTAKNIDRFTFRKNNGFYIREKNFKDLASYDEKVQEIERNVAEKTTSSRESELLDDAADESSKAEIAEADATVKKIEKCRS